MKKASVVLKSIGIALVPSILSYLSMNNNILDMLMEHEIIGKSVDIPMIKEVCIIGNIVVTSIILLGTKINENVKIKKYDGQIEGLISYCKELLCGAIANETDAENVHVNIRIFVPSSRLIDRIKLLVNSNADRYFEIKNIKGLAENDTTDNLRFKVCPEGEGLVGMCYRKKSICYDSSLKKTNSQKYGLNNSQLAKTNSLEFSMVVPIISESESVVAMVAFDSKQKINIKDINNISAAANTFSQLLYEKVPELFK